MVGAALQNHKASDPIISAQPTITMKADIRSSLATQPSLLFLLPRPPTLGNGVCLCGAPPGEAPLNSGCIDLYIPSLNFKLSTCNHNANA